MLDERKIWKIFVLLIHGVRIFCAIERFILYHFSVVNCTIAIWNMG